MMTKELESFRKEMEDEAQTWLGSCADDAFIAGVEWMYHRMQEIDLLNEKDESIKVEL